MDIPSRLLLGLVLVHSVAGYRISVGRADMTGPPTEVNFKGFTKLDQQTGTGLHTRQYARSFVVEDNGKYFAFVVGDFLSGSHGLRMEVLDSLGSFRGSGFNDDNLMLCGTHTHSTPGGYMQYMQYDYSNYGFVRETYSPYAMGISESISNANDTLDEGKISISEGELLDVNINRSPRAYLNNPEEELKRFKYDVDKTMVQLRFELMNGTIIGAFNWYPVQAVSMNSSNTLVSSDNLGYAALQLERAMNRGHMPGDGPFVGAFVASNQGDSSPNIGQPHCFKSNVPCDRLTQRCPRDDSCVAPGPGKNMRESTRIIGQRLADKALELLYSQSRDYIDGSVVAVHQYNHMPSHITVYYNKTLNKEVLVQGCVPAVGTSFLAGTIDWPSANFFSKSSIMGNMIWEVLKKSADVAPDEMKDCHHPKRILLTTGLMSTPCKWTPTVVSNSVAVLGDLAIACVPASITTMAGRRLRSVVQEGARLSSANRILVSGQCNGYTDYVTTPEEYEVQMFEGATTLYGPHTLTLYLDIYRDLAMAAVDLEESLHTEPSPNDFGILEDSIQPPVVMDNPQLVGSFGQILVQPPKSALPGSTVYTRFVGANPRNNLMHQGGTYLTVEQWCNGTEWKVVATDSSWETTFEWERMGTQLIGKSEVSIRWEIPEKIQPGKYRIQYFGQSVTMFMEGGMFSRYSCARKAFQSTTRTFQVLNKKKKRVQIKYSIL